MPGSTAERRRITVFADHGMRAVRRYDPLGRVRVESTQWRGMCVQAPRRHGTDHTYGDGTDLLAGSFGLAGSAADTARQVLARPAPDAGAGPAHPQDPWLTGFARRHGMEVTWAGFRQQVAVGTTADLLRDHRRLTTVEVVDPDVPGSSERVAWDDADVAGGRERLERAADSVRELTALPLGELPGTPVDVVLDPGLAGPFFHELVGHPREADVVAAGTSYLAERTGQQVAPAWFTVTDGPAPTGEGLAVRVDDEGVEVATVPLIDAGRVAGLLCDTLAGEPLGLTGNGHGRRLDYRHPLIPRMWHTRATCGGAAPAEPASTVRLHPRGLRLHWMNLLTGEVEFAAEDGVLDDGEGRPRRTGRCLLSGRALTLLAALRPGPATVRGGGRARKGCGKLGQFPVVTTFANCGLWIPGEAVDVRSDRT